MNERYVDGVIMTENGKAVTDLAYIERDYLLIDYYAEHLGESHVGVWCDSSSTFQKLPDAIRYRDHLLAKTGWNFDRSMAYYKNSDYALELLARVFR